MKYIKFKSPKGIERPAIEEYQKICADGYGNSDLVRLVDYIAALEEYMIQEIPGPEDIIENHMEDLDDTFRLLTKEFPDWDHYGRTVEVTEEEYDALLRDNTSVSKLASVLNELGAEV